MSALAVLTAIAAAAAAAHRMWQVLENVVKTRWGALPDAQREGIKTYCSNLIIKISTDEKAFRTERTFLNKLNLVRAGLQPGAPRPACSSIPSRGREGICIMAASRRVAWQGSPGARCCPPVHKLWRPGGVYATHRRSSYLPG